MAAVRLGTTRQFRELSWDIVLRRGEDLLCLSLSLLVHSSDPILSLSLLLLSPGNLRLRWCTFSSADHHHQSSAPKNLLGDRQMRGEMPLRGVEARRGKHSRADGMTGVCSSRQLPHQKTGRAFHRQSSWSNFSSVCFHRRRLPAVKPLFYLRLAGGKGSFSRRIFPM